MTLGKVIYSGPDRFNHIAPNYPYFDVFLHFLAPAGGLYPYPLGALLTLTYIQFDQISCLFYVFSWLFYVRFCYARFLIVPQGLEIGQNT